MILSPKSIKNNFSVLTVDDNLDNIYLIKYVLESMNIKCYGVNDSKSVFDLAINKAPNLILLDIVMPSMSGFDVLRQLKSNMFTKDIPVIAVTGLVSLYHQAKFKNAGFDDYICKPLTLEELEEKIIKHLNLCLLEVAA